MNVIDRRHMARALDLARRGLYSTGSNPRVGCVIARGERVVGEGWHRYAGEPHAEIHALAAAGGDSLGAIAYVTLEPCRHTGRTGPCTRALIEAGVVKVVAAMPDPDPRVAGQGFAELAEAGIEVETGLMEAPARALNRGFVSRHERGRPWVRCKLAATLDGRTATAAGESRWITGEAARADVHRLRAQADAVLTGIGTLLADDPRLDARVADARMEGAGCPALPIQPPMRVIVDSGLRTPPAARALLVPGDVLIATIGGGTIGGGGATGGGAEGPLDGGIARESGRTLAAMSDSATGGPIVDGIARKPGDALASTAGGIVTTGDVGMTAAAVEEPIVLGIARESEHPLVTTTGAAAQTGARARALVEAGAEIVALPDVGGRVSLPALMAALAGRGVNEVHAECGPTLAGALLESGLVDEIVVYLAPTLLGDTARGMFTLPGVTAMHERLWLEITGIARLGADLRIDAVPKIETDAEQRVGEAG